MTEWIRTTLALKTKHIDFNEDQLSILNALSELANEKGLEGIKIKNFHIIHSYHGTLLKCEVQKKDEGKLYPKLHSTSFQIRDEYSRSD